MQDGQIFMLTLVLCSTLPALEFSTIINHEVLASCPWGPATAHGVGILNELYVILAVTGEVVMGGRTHTQNHRPLLWIC